MLYFFFQRKVFNICFNFILLKQKCPVPFSLSITEKWNTDDMFVLFSKGLNFKPSRNFWYCHSEVNNDDDDNSSS